MEGSGSTSAASTPCPSPPLSPAPVSKRRPAVGLWARLLSLSGREGAMHRPPAACGQPPATNRPPPPRCAVPSHRPLQGVRPPAGLAVRRGDPAHGRAPATRRWRSPPAPLPPPPPPHPAMGAVAGGGSPPHFRWSSETARYKREAGVSGVKGPVTDVASPPLRVVDQTRVRPAYLPPPRVAHGVPTLHMHLRQRWSPAPPN